MKSRFCTLLAVLGMLAATSCTTDVVTVQPIDEGCVTFKLGVENGVGTRVISDGTSADELSYAVYDGEGNLVIAKASKSGVEGLTSEEGYSLAITLPRGRTYQVVFWAQDSDCTAYEVSDDMKVTVSYEGVNNDETRDAFFAVSEKFVVGKTPSMSITLKRPFAQVNVGTTPYDLEYAKSLGLDITKSSATIKAVPNVINLFDGAVEGAVDVLYTENLRPAEMLLADVDDNGEDEQYEYLSMSYLLAGAESTTHAMSFVFSNDNGETIDLASGLDYVPLQRNWRTNILGQILTGQAQFVIKIDPEYENETLYSEGVYYNFSEDTVIKDKIFAFNAPNDDAVFSTENNNLLTMENVTFSGAIFYIAIGEYRGKGEADVPYRNVLNNVRTENIVATNGISNVGLLDYMSIGVYLRGKSELNNCSFKGTTTSAEPFVYEKTGDVYPYIPYDCGVPNFCEAEFNDCEIDSFYAWSHSIVTLNNTKVKFMTCSTHNKSNNLALLTIGSGCEIGKIRVTSCKSLKNLVSPSLHIKAGAKIDTLDYNLRPNDCVVIEEGAEIGLILNPAE